jgi:hypothetical protein
MNLAPLVIGDLRIDPELEGDALRLVWTGKSNARQADKGLGPYLDAALAQAAAQGLRLELRFERLLHFNSSTIAGIITIIHAARARGTPLTLVSDPNRQWQRLSFDALRVFVTPDGLFSLRAAESAS